MSAKIIFRHLAHAVFRTRQFQERSIRIFASGIVGKRILELGSGKKTGVEYEYSLKKYFDPSNGFVQSDVVAEYGHTIVDVTEMDFREEFDIVICTSVLEHVFDFRKAIDNIHSALKPGGMVAIALPVFYPLHDEPMDYWRFTEHSLRKLLADFQKVEIQHHGLRQYPFSYFITAAKGVDAKA